MQYDLLIRNGTVVDGSGLPRFRADVGIVAGKIAAIGKIRDSASNDTNICAKAWRLMLLCTI